MKKKFLKICKTMAQNFKTTDLFLVFMVMAASTLSLVLILSLYPKAIKFRPVLIHAAVMLVGFPIAFFVSNIDYHKIAKLWKPMAILFGVLTILQFTVLGTVRGGNNLAGTETGSANLNWINLGFTKIQPSEFLKVAFIVTFAFHCSMVLHKINEPKTFIKLVAHAMVPVLIIFLQKDYGTMLIFLTITPSMLLVSGINWKIVSIGIGCAAIMLVLFMTNTLPEFLLKRFIVLQDLEKYKDGAGWQQYHGNIALSSGKIFGKGFTSENILVDTPELHNDMIFVHIGQTLGFIGCLATLIWICAVCIRILQHAKNAQDNLGYLICIGCFSLVFFQSAVNIGMALSLTPVVGVNLPFFSSGGSSAIANFLLLGLILSVQKHSFKPTLFQ